MRGHERARDAGRLAERAHVDDALRRKPEVGERAAARILAVAQHAEAVRVVDDEPRVVLLGERAAARGSGAMSPSMLNTASVAISLRFAVDAARRRASAATSPCG